VRKLADRKEKGAFTPTCSESHLPGYIKHVKDLKAKGVDVIGLSILYSCIPRAVLIATAVAGYNDPFVMSAWSKAQGVKNDDILFVSDEDAEFSKSIGWNEGPRTARYAIVIDHGKVTYAAKEQPGKLEVNTLPSISSGN